MNVVATSWFTTGEDPQRLVKNQPTYNNIKLWYESVCDLKLNGIIFHDNFSDQFTNKYTNTYVSFVKCNSDLLGLYSPNDFRFINYSDYFSNNHKVKNLFVTDCNDVIVRNDPFKDICAGSIYFCSEQRILVSKNSEPTIRNNPWCFNLYKHVYPDFKYWERAILNCGVIGGDKDTMLAFLNNVKREINSINPVRSFFKSKPYCVDMAVTTKIAYDMFSKDEIITGEPVHSVYKLNQTNRNDVWFVHK